ncbi:MAG: FecR domain-containing protein [Myxococcales bacterium]|nr:FecR domain-containing protein [Myxococcales bacterium]
MQGEPRAGALAPRFRDRDALLATAAVLVAAGSGALLARTGQPGGAEEAGPAIAEVSFTTSQVRRRLARTLVWEEIRTGAAVHDGDSIFVPPRASASISFVDGSSLEVDENSLVVLQRPGGGAPNRVGLKKGSVTGATSQSGMAIESERGLASLQGDTQARVDLQVGQARVDVFSGAARVQGAGGAQTVREKQAAMAGADGRWSEPRALQVELVAPARNGRVYFRGSPPPLALGWVHRDVAEGATLQVARDRGFGFIVHSAPASSGTHLFTQVSPGIFWWRLVDEDGQPISEARRFTILEDLPPTPLSPAKEEIVWATPEHPVLFAWTKVEGSAGYRVEVSSSDDFEQTVLSELANQPQLLLEEPLPEGHYLWRVRVEDKLRGESSFSKALGFRLIHKALPAAPELLNPEIELEPDASSGE